MKKIVLLVLALTFLLSTGCQSRAISRFTGASLKFASGRKGEKDLFYWSIDGQMKVKTYTDWGLLESHIVFVNK